MPERSGVFTGFTAGGYVAASSISGEGVDRGVIGWDSGTGVPTLSAEVVGDEGWDSSEFLFVSQFSVSVLQAEEELTTDFRDESDGGSNCGEATDNVSS